MFIQISVFVRGIITVGKGTGERSLWLIIDGRSGGSITRDGGEAVLNVLFRRQGGDDGVGGGLDGAKGTLVGMGGESHGISRREGTKATD